jgi:tetratricopeptide (TPR) repeat protein
MNVTRRISSRVSSTALLLAMVAMFRAATASAAVLDVPPDAQKALDTIYAGDTQQGAELARAFERAQPQNPLGYLIEGEALWWRRYCEASEIKFGVVEIWRHDRKPGDEGYLALADKAIALAQAQLAKSNSAAMHFYAGMGYALKVRMYGLRGENRAATKSGIAARSEMLAALQLDPQLADATAAMGIYNYYVDTLSPMLKFLRFLMGIPGGDKQQGIRQMEVGMTQGKLLAVDVRFILASALRRYDRQYQQALSVAEPLVRRYPQNATFLLLGGNLNRELGRNAKAEEYFRAVEQLSGDSPCVAHARDLARSFSAALP